MALRPRLGLRWRIAIGFAVVALAVAGALATLAYQRTRAVIVGQRQDAAVAQTFVNARLVRDALRDPASDVGELLASLSTANRSEPLLRQGGRSYGRSVTIDASALPAPLQSTVASGRASRQRFVVDDEPMLAVGVPIPAIGSEYFEIFPLDDIDSTLQTLRTALLSGAGVAGIGVAGIGLLASRRVLRPLASAAEAARQIASGDLSTRVAAPADRELVPLVAAFNEMASSLAARVERDRRFASVVSHELRSPLTSLRTSMDVALTRLPPLDDRAQVAIALVQSQLDRFERMTLDLLEISRFDAGVATLDARPTEIGTAVREIVDAGTNGAVPTVVDGDVTISVDTTRLEWCLANLLANAEHHGGGATAVRVVATQSTVCISVDDAGPGVPVGERDRIFDRFARGAGTRGTPGAGLGLSLVREHARVMGGRVTVEDAPGGGARFTIELPR